MAVLGTRGVGKTVQSPGQTAWTRIPRSQGCRGWTASSRWKRIGVRRMLPLVVVWGPASSGLGCFRHSGVPKNNPPNHVPV